VTHAIIRRTSTAAASVVDISQFLDPYPRFYPRHIARTMANKPGAMLRQDMHQDRDQMGGGSVNESGKGTHPTVHPAPQRAVWKTEKLEPLDLP
jgi:hypothetical protein